MPSDKVVIISLLGLRFDQATLLYSDIDFWYLLNGISFQQSAIVTYVQIVFKKHIQDYSYDNFSCFWIHFQFFAYRFRLSNKERQKIWYSQYFRTCQGFWKILFLNKLLIFFSLQISFIGVCYPHDENEKLSWTHSLPLINFLCRKI